MHKTEGSDSYHPAGNTIAILQYSYNKVFSDASYTNERIDETRMVQLPATAAIEYVAACCITRTIIIIIIIIFFITIVDKPQQSTCTI